MIIDFDNLDSFFESGQALAIFGTEMVEKILLDEAKRLKGYVNEFISRYYGSYSPSIYMRTGGLQNSFEVKTTVAFSAATGEASIKLGFEDYASKSVFKNLLYDGFQGYQIPSLVNYGWSVKSGWHKNIPMFGSFGGAHFLEKAIDKFNASNPYGILVSIG